MIAEKRGKWMTYLVIAAAGALGSITAQTELIPAADHEYLYWNAITTVFVLQGIIELIYNHNEGNQ